MRMDSSTQSEWVLCGLNIVIHYNAWTHFWKVHLCLFSICFGAHWLIFHSLHFLLLIQVVSRRSSSGIWPRDTTKTAVPCESWSLCWGETARLTEISTVLLLITLFRWVNRHWPKATKLQMWFHRVFNIVCVWDQAWLSTLATLAPTKFKHGNVFV